MQWSHEELVEQWTPMVRAARGVLGYRDEAEECAAEALIQILERQPTDVANLQAFMVTVAKRRAIDRLRTLERIRIRDEKLAGFAGCVVVDVAEDVVARAEARWVNGQAQELLRPHVYEVLQLIADGQSVEQVASALGMTPRAAQSHLRRARMLLRSALAKTLALIGLGFVWLRRNAMTGATTALAASAMLLGAPNLGGHARAPGPTPRALPVMPLHDDSRQSAAVHNSTQASPSAQIASKPQQAPVGEGMSAPNVHVSEPLGASTAVETDRHGSGPPAGPVGTIRQCVHDFTVTPQHVGC
jgi:RNA polymerase sigma-70 factor (ECF subfamily)